jgi:uncharacterized protein YgiB involved in biofilm formation
MTSKRKRSASLKLTTMLAGAASFTLAGCDRPSASAQWEQPSAAKGEQVQAFAYSSLGACKIADEVSDADCEAGWAAAQNDDAARAPRYNERSTCEDVYGAGNCVPRGSGGGSFFVPLLTGFVIGQLLDGGGRPYYRGTSLYRQDERYGGGYHSGWGGSLGRDYSSGRTTIARGGIEPPEAIRQAPPRVQTRTAVVSRGGFGGGRGYSFGG